MKKLLQVSLLATAVMAGLSGCNEEQAASVAPADKAAPAAENATAAENKTAENTVAPSAEGSAELGNFEDKSAYAIGLSMGRYIGSTLEKQQELGITLNNDVILQGVKDGFGTDAKMTEEEVKQALMDYDTHINELIETKSKEEAAATLKEGQEFLEKNAKRDGVQVTESGLQYEVLTDAEGDKPAAEDVVTVHYTGTLIDGTTFDSSVERGEPASFPLNQVIPGWTEGVQLMPVGAKYKFFIPADLAYGETGAGSIPGNAVLIFEVELLEIEKAADAEEAVAAQKEEATQQ
ncbi:FKBP-type peptidyl-prolyl cis-trans isomerase [Oceanimonas baumannii]|uniref:Peptidyl-prolyl cis-trans isomerase n=1 Tax=Oceanimonas baumannii TaxID=129578 RepID=A0A235CEQ9_9GAMM|nr:FKBP-type peptidyl-prolyl cis-trans isomerase [Oceanimonas baumannii]OYD22916.1 peptidylprolyl isomerase [Oceanimonas baumannii]TDW56259.1 FKBP-type peptidyl-prolyl cis-trans isomerase FkpA [Oceanimonas baumannii]